MTGDGSNTADTATQSATLRAELKDWERAFAAANAGRKAERSDIKNDATIAAKYKEYGRLKSLEASSTEDNHAPPANTNRADQTNPDRHSKKRKHASSSGAGHPDAATTPHKTAKNIFTTPSANRFVDSHPAQLDPYDSPSALRRLFSPSTHRTPLKTAVGPTPQRDGKTLGLFDLLSESGGSAATPTANRTASMHGAAVRTPSKRSAMETIAEEDEGEEEETLKPERTPASSGKRFMLSSLFATPTTMRYAAMADGEDNAMTAGNGNQGDGDVDAREAVGSGTPSFLRRSNPGRNANGMVGGFSPTAVRKPQPFVGRGLSAIVQGLRDMEEERLQDDTDVLREVEAEAAAAGDAEVNDSQEPANDPAPPRRKKTQKRTTRRVIMKPVVAPKPRRKPQRIETDREGDDDEDTAVPETQHSDAERDDGVQPDDMDDAASIHTTSEPDLGSDPEYAEQPNANGAKSKSFSEKLKEAVSSVAKPKSESRGQKASQSASTTKDEKKPRARKVNHEAHANYRALKIRNKGTKGRFAGRFRR
ncbi:hypothetical protein PHISP_03536 [Aspergillus sp. HF37]|nr:hypothetical protein PHISP_03536 [Aspergillus sp. HF37]